MATAGTSHDASLGTNRTNCARLCHAVIQLFPQILQELMTSKQPQHKLLSDTRSNKYLSKKLYVDELLLVQNAHTNGYEGFDISLIYKLIRHLNLIPPPSRGWDYTTPPTSTEITPGDDLERIRRIRNNKLFHKGNAHVSNVELNEYFMTFKEIAERLERFLGKSKEEFTRRFDYLQTCCMDEATEQLYLERLEKQRTKESGEEKTTADVVQNFNQSNVQVGDHNTMVIHEK